MKKHKKINKMPLMVLYQEEYIRSVVIALVIGIILISLGVYLTPSDADIALQFKQHCTQYGGHVVNTYQGNVCKDATKEYPV